MFHVRDASEVTGLGLGADVLVPVPPDCVPVDAELLRERIERRTTGAQQLDAPALLVAANLAVGRSRSFHFRLSKNWWPGLPHPKQARPSPSQRGQEGNASLENAVKVRRRGRLCVERSDHA